MSELGEIGIEKEGKRRRLCLSNRGSSIIAMLDKLLDNVELVPGYVPGKFYISPVDWEEVKITLSDKTPWLSEKLMFPSLLYKGVEVELKERLHIPYLDLMIMDHVAMIFLHPDIFEDDISGEELEKRFFERINKQSYQVVNRTLTDEKKDQYPYIITEEAGHFSSFEKAFKNYKKNT